MATSAEKLAQRLRSEGEKIATFFARLGPQDWERPVYSDGELWRVRDVLAHFVASERGFLRLLQNVSEGGPGASPDFSIDEYNRKQVSALAGSSPQELLSAWQESRAATVRWVAERSQEDLARVGRHPFLGETTLAEMIKMIYLHNQMHYRDLRRLMEQA